MTNSKTLPEINFDLERGEFIRQFKPHSPNITINYDDVDADMRGYVLIKLSIRDGHVDVIDNAIRYCRKVNSEYLDSDKIWTSHSTIGERVRKLAAKDRARNWETCKWLISVRYYMVNAKLGN